MIYIQFFQRSELNAAIYLSACGDRAVIILDGRQSRQTHNDIAYNECPKRGYVGWKIMQGESFTRSSPITTLFTLTASEEKFSREYQYARTNGYRESLTAYMELQYAGYVQICERNDITPMPRSEWFNKAESCEQPPTNSKG